MKNQTFHRMLKRFSLFLFGTAVSLITACSDDPESTNEEELITTVWVTLDPEEEEGEVAGEVITLGWDDSNLDAIVDPGEVVVSGPLLSDKTYTASIQILNKSVDPQIDITEEINEEAEDHIFCFTVLNVGISITNLNEDRNGLPLGVTSTWSTASTVSSGTVNITLRHQPGVKTGDCPGVGDTDATVTFPVQIAVPDA